MAKNVSELASLNGIRGFAVLLVLLSHASNDGILFTQDLNFSGAGHYGVFLFFVLSSFLLTRQFLIAGKGKIFSRKSLSHYFLRRFLRIYPLYFAALLIYAFLHRMSLDIVPVSAAMIGKSLLLVDAEGLFWTIPVEFQFYFLLPVVAALLRLGGSVQMKSIAGILFCICWTVFFPPRYSVNLLPFLPVFVLGSLAAAWFAAIEMQASLRTAGGKRLCRIAACILLFSFIILSPRFLGSVLPFNGARDVLQYQFIFFGLLSAGLVLTTLCSDGLVRRLLEGRFFTFWGKISFSAYLGHKIILAFVLELVSLPVSVKFFLFFALTALCSSLSYTYFERPLSGYHKRINSFVNK